MRTLAEMMLNYLEHLVIQQGSLRRGEHEAWKRFVVRSLRGSPVMQTVLDEAPDSYSDELVQLYRRLDKGAGGASGSGSAGR